MLAPELLPHPISVAFSVPKSKFKRAVDRNLLKRRLRHAYRVNKSSWYEELHAKNQQLLLVMIYGPKSMHSFEMIEKDVKKGMKQLIGKLS